MNTGWICPKCGNVYSPTVEQCRLCSLLAKVHARPLTDDARDDEARDIIAITDRIDIAVIKARLLAHKPKEYGIPLREALGYMWAHAKADPEMPKNYVTIIGYLFDE